MDEALVKGEERIGAEALFRAHAQFVASFLQRFGAPAQDVDDMVQEVFIVAHRKGGYVLGPAQPRTWLAAIAVHVAQSNRRSRNRRERHVTANADAALEQVIGPLDPHEEFETRNALRRLQSALDGLPPEHRAAFVLYEIEGESCESIAAEWKVPIGTVYSRLHSARRRVVETYEQQVANAAPTSSTRRHLQQVNGEP